MDPTQYLSTGEAARELGVSPQWAYKLARGGELEYVETSLGLLVSRRSVEALAQRRAVARGGSRKPAAGKSRFGAREVANGVST